MPRRWPFFYRVWGSKVTRFWTSTAVEGDLSLRESPQLPCCFSLVGMVSLGTSRAMLLILCRKCCTQRMFLKRAVPAAGEATRAGTSLTHSPGAAGSHYRSLMASSCGKCILTRDSDRLPDCKIRSTSMRWNLR